MARSAASCSQHVKNKTIDPFFMRLLSYGKVMLQSYHIARNDITGALTWCNSALDKCLRCFCADDNSILKCHHWRDCIVRGDKLCSRIPRLAGFECE